MCLQGKAVIEHYINELLKNGTEHIVAWKEPGAKTDADDSTANNTSSPHHDSTPASEPLVRSVGAKPKLTSTLSNVQESQGRVVTRHVQVELEIIYY